MALTAATTRATRANDQKSFADYVVGTSSTIYAGGLVCVNTTTGRAVAASAATGRKFLGLAEETKTGNSSGTVRCRVSWGHEALIDTPATGLTAAYIGSNAAVSDDNQVTSMSDAGTTAVRVRVGEVVEIEGGDVWVRLRNYSEADV